MLQHQITSVEHSHKFNTRHSARQRMTWNRNLPDDVISALWESPENVLRRGYCLQAKSRTIVARVDFASGSYLLKFHHWAGFWKALSKSLATSPNRRSFNDGLTLAERGVPTQLPLACVDVRLGPFNICSYLLTEFVPGTSLYRTMRYGEPSIAAVDDYAQQVAHIWQLLDDMQYCHNDLKPENLMIDQDDRVRLIDLENGRWHTDRELLRRGQVADLKRLLHVRSWRAKPQAAEQFRQRLRATRAAQAALAETDDRAHPLETVEVGGGTPQGLTVFIPCRNSVHDIRGCVESVRDFADEILVADAGSSDGTWELVQNLPYCRALRFDHSDSEMRRRAIAEATHSWVLLVQPDERVSSDLAKEIQFLLASNPTSDGFCIELRTHFCGHVIRFGESAGDMPVRLVRKDHHTLLEASQLGRTKRSETVGKLRCTIDCRFGTIAQLAAELNKSANADARAWQSRGRKPSMPRVLFHAPLNFLRSYFVKLGCLDGWAGLHLAILSATSVYVRYATLWQLQHSLPSPNAGSAIEDERNAVRRKAAYNEQHSSLRALTVRDYSWSVSQTLEV